LRTTRVQADPGVPLIIVERHFTAPPALVYRAWTEPDLLTRWLGPKDLKLTVDRWEFHDGGRWRYVSTGPDGSEYAFRGLFHGEPSLQYGITQTFEFEGFPGAVSLETLSFIPADGGTLTRTISAFTTVEARDGKVASGMEDGMTQGFAQLDDLLVELQGAR
jgi:uncharacterized protein YndB with AHSA1/START domain